MKSLTVTDFDLTDTLECGQTFCWTKEGEGYVNADIGQVVYVVQKGDTLQYESSADEIDISTLLGLRDPIREIKQEIARDELLKTCITFAPGIRIARDPFFPCLVSFLCSIRNNIPNIQRMVQRIRDRYGPAYQFRGHELHGFPTPEQLSGATIDELRGFGLDWRADFVSRSTASILAGDIKPEELEKMKYEEAHEVLKDLHGVGDKVSDCVCLFSLGFLEAFPIDVWIERVIQEHYGLFTDVGKSYSKKSRAARDYFGKYAGYAQEYLYYYTRTGGKKPKR
ncbi:MAG: 8-oxoguanine DNA glycosylase [Candidatus Thorarchaeota archaeon]|nr:MAG: 8-oxoguanine DNA glycosylase [Candidatus Thorarchaeota archaeon]